MESGGGREMMFEVITTAQWRWRWGESYREGWQWYLNGVSANPAVGSAQPTLPLSALRLPGGCGV